MKQKGPACRQAGFASIIILLGIAIFILIGGGVVYQNFLIPQANPNPAPTITPSQIPSPTTTASPTPDPTANWKTYENEKYHFSLKYPDSWTINEQGNSILSGDQPKLVVYFENKNSSPANSLADPDYIQILLTYYKPSADPNTFFKQFINPSTFTLVDESKNKYYVESKNEGLSGVHAYLINSKRREIIEIGNTILTNGKVTEARTYFDQILSTFKFLD